MPLVRFSGSACLGFTGGATEVEVTATTVRRLILELDQRFPGLGHQIEAGMAIAIDGEIHQDAYGTSLRPDSEIFLIPRIGGG
ncbi:MAG: MoaD/ThiS family protein [Alphaproteobacteria bacterium]|nr:MoaD/ThiS family protein [Alphaproteobacteria bacterium]